MSLIFVFSQVTRGLTRTPMDLSVMGCKATAFKNGSIIADLAVDVVQPAMHFSRIDLKLNLQNLERLFNRSAAQSLAGNYTLSLQEVDVEGMIS